MALIERVAGYHRMPQELFEQGPKAPHQQTALILILAGISERSLAGAPEVEVESHEHQ